MPFIYSIEIKNLQKKYEGAEQKALENLSLQFKKGKISGLLGPNGAGKTTTISILCGLVKADSGDAKVLGLNAGSEMLRIKRKIGIIPQQIALYPQLTVKENLKYIGKLYKIPNVVLKERINDYLSYFGLSEHRHKKIKAYSGGMKRRANLIAGILHDPELIILDEPTAGVDVHSRNMILDFLKDYNKKGKSIIYTSHLLEEAQRLCDDVAIVDEGKVIIQGSPDQLIAEADSCKNLEEVFLFYTGRSLRE